MKNQFSLDHLRALVLSGPDAHAFANAQLTLAAGALSDTAWRPLAWCEPKGRVLATMMARTNEENVELVLPESLVEPVRKRLEMFTIGRSVRIGPARTVAGMLGVPDEAPVLALDEKRGMALIDGAPEDHGALERWRRLDLCAGLPWLCPATSGQHLPQSLGLERLGALAFDKGCYPGQEVIARLHYRGTSKYRLMGIEMGGDAAPAPQARITDRSDRPVGHCIESLEAGNEHVGLAVLSTAVEPGATVVVNDGEAGGIEARVTTPDTLC